MRLIHHIARLIMRPFELIRAIIARPRLATDTTTATITGNTIRSAAANVWRKAIRAAIVTIGFMVYAGMQYGMASLISNFWWWYIVTFFIITGSFILAATRPMTAFLLWLIVSPFGARFLGLNLQWSALPPLTFDMVAIYFLATMLLFKNMLNRTQPKPLATEFLMLAMPAYIAITYIVSNQASGFAEILRYFTRLFIPDALYIVVLYFTAKACIQKKEHISWFMVSLVMVGLFMAIIAFYEHFTGNRWYSVIVGFGLPLKWKDVGEGRASGMFDSVSAPATLVATTLFIAYHLAGWTKRPLAAAFYYITMALMIAGAYFTFTRNVYVAVILFAMLIPLFSVEKRPRFVRLALVFILGLAIAVPIVLSDAKMNRRMTSSTNIYARYASTSTFINMFKQNMWFGVGWSNADKRALEYVTSMKHRGGGGVGNTVRWVDNAHCTYVTVIAEQGIIGGTLYFGAMIALILHLCRIRKRKDVHGFFGKDLVSLFIVSSICYMVSIISWSNHIVHYPNYVFWIQLAVMVRFGQILEQEASIKNDLLSNDTERSPLTLQSGR